MFTVRFCNNWNITVNKTTSYILFSLNEFINPLIRLRIGKKFPIGLFVVVFSFSMCNSHQRVTA